MKKKLLFILIPVIVLLITSGIVLGSFQGWWVGRDAEKNDRFKGYTVIDLENTNVNENINAFSYKDSGFVDGNSTSYTINYLSEFGFLCNSCMYKSISIRMMQ